MNLNEIYLRDDDRLAWRIIDGECIIMNPDAGSVFNLNEVGARIWELLEDNRKIEKVVACITNEFDINIQQAREDTLSFIKQLLGNNFVIKKRVL